MHRVAVAGCFHLVQGGSSACTAPSLPASWPPGLLSEVSFQAFNTCCFLTWVAAPSNQPLCTTGSFSSVRRAFSGNLIAVFLFRIFFKSCPYLFTCLFPSTFSSLNTQRTYNGSVNIN